MSPPRTFNRDYNASAINQKRCGDFKQINTAAGPVFLATVEDLYSGRMDGFATSGPTRDGELAEQATGTAVATRGGDTKDVIFHTYGSDPMTTTCRAPSAAVDGSVPRDVRDFS